MIETWRSLDAFAVAGYEVSDAGLVRCGARPLTPWRHKSGHLYVRLKRKPERQTWQVHHLVLYAFVGAPLPGQECRHLNGDPQDNRLANLKWGTRLENIKDLIATSGRAARGGLTYEQAAKIRGSSDRSWGWQRRLALKYGVHECTISKIILRQSYVTEIL